MKHAAPPAKIAVPLPPGAYVLAVSGGVDSMALFHMLAGQPGFRLAVAHVEHGIRADAPLDKALVEAAAQNAGLSFYWLKVRLGASASEATARAVRYDFLESLRLRLGFDAVVTAHHRDDLLETSLLHVLRGTGRRGLAGLGETPVLKRPLLGYSKARLITYAQQHKVPWREDSTNTNTVYRRNFVRQELLPYLKQSDPAFEGAWLRFVARAAELNKGIQAALDKLMAQEIQQSGSGWSFRRDWFASLPHSVAREMVYNLSRRAGVRDLSKKRIEQLTISLKTGKIQRRYDCDGTWEFRITQDSHGQTKLILAQK